jgi:hypothetical protein
MSGLIQIQKGIQNLFGKCFGKFVKKKKKSFIHFLSFRPSSPPQPLTFRAERPIPRLSARVASRLGRAPFSPAAWFTRAPSAQQRAKRAAALSFFDCVTDVVDPSVRRASFLKPTPSSLSKNADVESSPQSPLSFRGDAFGLYKSSP